MTAMPNIVLAGFMGTGKTTIGQIVANRLGRPFIDLDEAIEAEAGQPIARIFADEGEAAFRSLEAQIARKIAAHSGQVIATGGGTLLNADTRAAFAGNSLLVCLTADPETIMERVAGDETRPLAQNREALITLMGNRAALYASLPYHVDTTDRTPEQAAEEVIRIWMQHTV
jgi:shikimate kinase